MDLFSCVISIGNLRVCLQRPQYSSKTVKGNTNNLITQFLEQGTSSKDAISGRLNQLGNAFLKCATTVHLITTSEMQKGSLIDLQILRDEKLQQLGKSDGSEKQCKSYHVPHDALKRFRRLKVPSKYWTLAMFDDLGKIMDDEIRMLVAWRESIAAGSTEQRINDYLVLTAAHFVERGYRSALLFLSWLGQRVLPVKIIRKKSTSDSVLGMNGCYELIYGHWQRPEFVSRSIRKQSLEKAHDLSLGSAGIEDEIAYQFKDQFLLLQTVTHRSFAANTITPANEQLIFLGDALLSFLLAKCLFHHPSQFDLERNAFIKNVLESRANGANAIVRCDLQKFLLYSEDDMRQQMDLYVEQRRDQYFDIQIDVNFSCIVCLPM